MNIRNLMKIIALGTALILAGFLPIDSESSKQNDIEEDYTFSVQTRIGCLVGEIDIEKTLENFQAERDYDIIFSDVIDEAFMNQLCSAIVIDRHLIGKTIWKKYLDFFNKSDDDTPIVIVNDIRDWIVPARGEGRG